MLLTHVKKVFQVSNLYKRLMYKCSAVQQPLSKQQNVHCKFLNLSESTYVLRNDMENCDFRHQSSFVVLIYKTVRARKQNIKQQKKSSRIQLLFKKVFRKSVQPPHDKKN